MLFVVLPGKKSGCIEAFQQHDRKQNPRVHHVRLELVVRMLPLVDKRDRTEHEKDGDGDAVEQLREGDDLQV